MNVSTANPCEQDAWLCNQVYDATGSERFAEIVDWFVAKPMAILALVVAGVLLRWIVRRVITRTLARAAKSAGRRTARNAARTETFASVLKSIASFVIFGVVTVMIVAELGYNVAPLIAGAGIVGLALSLGAQHVIRDFLYGMYMFVEDQLGVGDTVTLDGVTGVVEELNLRTTKLISEDGTVWYLRNGDVSRVGNHSQR